MQGRAVGRHGRRRLEHIPIAHGAVAGDHGTGRDGGGHLGRWVGAQRQSAAEAEHLAAARVEACDLHPVSAQQRVERAGAVHRHPECEPQRPGRGDADAQAGEGAGPRSDHDRIQIGVVDTGALEQMVDVRQQPLCGRRAAPAHPFRNDPAVSPQAGGRNVSRGIEGEQQQGRRAGGNRRRKAVSA